jgi:hypothetical protein
MIAIHPTLTLIPIPAFAPVESPPEDKAGEVGLEEAVAGCVDVVDRAEVDLELEVEVEAVEVEVELEVDVAEVTAEE